MSFEELVRAHHARVLRVCESVLRDRDEAEDAAQEVFLKAHAAWERFRGESSPATWLHRLAVNHCLDRLRAAKRRSEWSLEGLLERLGEAGAALAGSEPGPAARLEAADASERLLSKLTPEQRAALALRESAGMSYQEIAEAMGDSLDSVKARLRRARRTLEEEARHFPGLGDVQ